MLTGLVPCAHVPQAPFVCWFQVWKCDLRNKKNWISNLKKKLEDFQLLPSLKKDLFHTTRSHVRFKVNSEHSNCRHPDYKPIRAKNLEKLTDSLTYNQKTRYQIGLSSIQRYGQ